MSKRDEAPLTEAEQAEWKRLIAEARKHRYEVERTWAVHLDGSKELLSSVVHPKDRIPGVVYDDSGLPDVFATAIQRRRQELERKAEGEKSRARQAARKRKLKREARDRAIADFALKAARKSDELADNPKMLTSYVGNRWRDDWGKLVARSTVRRILAEQRVASRLRSQ